ncbi:MAG: class II aldolase/adducin family protein [Acidimicrobiales bacterium]
MGAGHGGETSEAEEVALASRVLDHCGLGDLVWGHVSCRDRAGRGAWLKASGFGLEEIDSGRVVLVDGRGKRLLPRAGGVHLEYRIHTFLLDARADINAVVHCHPAYAIAFAATGEALVPMSHEGALFSPPDVARFEVTGDLIHTDELGRALVECIGSRNAALMPKHGIVTVGPDVATAVMSAVLLERACRLQLLAQGGGGVAVWSSPEEALAKRDRCWAPSQIQAGYDYLARQVTPG